MSCYYYSMKPDIQTLTSALQASWDSDTAYEAGAWSQDNKARGQCVVSCLVVQDYLGGELIRYAVSSDQLNETHYMNQLDDGTVIDTTASQYKEPVTMLFKPINLDGVFNSIRDKRLADASTRARYALLKQRVESFLAKP